LRRGDYAMKIRDEFS